VVEPVQKPVVEVAQNSEFEVVQKPAVEVVELKARAETAIEALVEVETAVQSVAVHQTVEVVAVPVEHWFEVQMSEAQTEVAWVVAVFAVAFQAEKVEHLLNQIAETLYFAETAEEESPPIPHLKYYLKQNYRLQLNLKHYLKVNFARRAEVARAEQV